MDTGHSADLDLVFQLELLLGIVADLKLKASKNFAEHMSAAGLVLGRPLWRFGNSAPGVALA